MLTTRNAICRKRGKFYTNRVKIHLKLIMVTIDAYRTNYITAILPEILPVICVRCVVSITVLIYNKENM